MDLPKGVQPAKFGQVLALSLLTQTGLFFYLNFSSKNSSRTLP